MNYNEIISKMTALVELAKKEDRSFNEAEQKEYDGLSQMAKDKLKMKENDEVLKQLADSSNTIVEERAVPTPQITVGKEHDRSKEHRSAFCKNLVGLQLTKQEKRALEAGEAAEGGNLVPMDFIAELTNRIRNINQFRQLARVIPLQRSTTIPVHTTKAVGAVRAEEADVSSSVTQPAFGKETLNYFEIYNEVIFSRELVQQSAVNLESFLIEELALSIAEKEEALIVNGAGTTEPTGIAKVTAVAGVNVGGVEQGSSASGTITLNMLINLYKAMNRKLRAGAVWVMNDDTHKAIMNLLAVATTEVGTANNTYRYDYATRLFLANPRENLDGKILGLDVIISDYMPDLDGDNLVSVSLVQPKNMIIADFGGLKMARADGDLTLMRQGQSAISVFSGLDMKFNSPDAVVHLNNEDTA